MILLMLSFAGATAPVDPIPAELPDLPERNPPPKLKLKGIEVPPDLSEHFLIALEPNTKQNSREARLKSLEGVVAQKRHQIAVHQQAMSAQSTIETVRPAVLAGVLFEEHAASILDTWVPEGMTAERVEVYKGALWRKAIPECRRALTSYEEAVKLADEARNGKALKIATAGVERMTPADASIEAQMIACGRAYNW